MVLNVFDHAAGLEVGSFFDDSDPQMKNCTVPTDARFYGVT